MKTLLRIVLALLLICMLIVAFNLNSLRQMAADKNYPADVYLKEETNKSALIIVAHDDDIASSSGTLKMLTDQGWKISELCFYQEGGLYKKKDSIKNPIRKQSLKRVKELQGLEKVYPTDFNFRLDMQTEQAYMPMPYPKFKENYLVDSMYQYIDKVIKKHQPSVIFSLDNVLGGYGNPDHVLVSQLVSKYCKDHKNDDGFSVKKIYQAVFAPIQAITVMDDMPVYHEAKKVYGCDGPPEPTVEFNISSYSKIKKQVLLAYTTEQNSLTKVWPYYEWYPHWIYFYIFDREYFNVIDVDEIDKQNIFL